MWNLDINGTNNQLFDHIVLEQLDQPQRSRKVCMDYGTIMVLKCTAALYFFLYTSAMSSIYNGIMAIINLSECLSLQICRCHSNLLLLHRNIFEKKQFITKYLCTYVINFLIKNFHLQQVIKLLTRVSQVCENQVFKDVQH